jgi:hypothetical protein
MMRTSWSSPEAVPAHRRNCGCLSHLHRRDKKGSGWEKVKRVPRMNRLRSHLLPLSLMYLAWPSDICLS